MTPRRKILKRLTSSKEEELASGREEGLNSGEGRIEKLTSGWGEQCRLSFHTRRLVRWLFNAE